MCIIDGNMNGLTTWRVGGSSECALLHRTTSFSVCGPGNAFAARSGTGFGLNGSSFSSTLSGTSDPALDDTLVECFGTPNSTDPGNRINGSTLQIQGQCVLEFLTNKEKEVLPKMLSTFAMFTVTKEMIIKRKQYS